MNEDGTIITAPKDIRWQVAPNFLKGMVDQVNLLGAPGDPGPYLVLIRWYPGYMSAPHFYESDRLSVVLSGTWYIGSGADYSPETTVPVRAGTVVRRVAMKAHYDGVLNTESEPATIAICGMGPIHFNRTDPNKPFWRIA